MPAFFYKQPISPFLHAGLASTPLTIRVSYRRMHITHEHITCAHPSGYTYTVSVHTNAGEVEPVI